jgi:biotin-[acetyl-CoA-carboxylase] ligase BirA-like protein
MMNHYHFKELNSTQDFIINEIIEKKSHESFIPTLVTCDKQSAGKGRKGNEWSFFLNSLAMSCTFQARFDPESLLALWLANTIHEFLLQKTDNHIALKWPNDFYIKTKNEQFKKCGGLIVHQRNSLSIIGFGLNLHSNNYAESNNEHPQFGYVSVDEDPQTLAKNLYQYLLDQSALQAQQSAGFIKDSFLKKCFHMKKNVQIIDGANTFIGESVGIDQYGGLTIKLHSSNSLHTVYNGSVLIEGIHF